MPRRIFLLSRIPILAILFAALPVSSQTFRIAGVVVDSISGAPIDRATVTIASVANLEEATTALSSASGQFSFAGLSPGKYRLLASRNGFTQQGLDQHEGYMTAIAIGPGLDSEHIRFRLSRESVIAGNVSDEYGEPVRSAEVFLFQHKIFSGLRTTNQVQRTTTDDLGDYRFAHLPPGSYLVAVHAKPWYGNSSGFSFATRSATLARVADRVRAFSRESVDFTESAEDAEGPVRTAEPLTRSSPNPLLDVVYPVLFYSNADSLDSATSLSLTPGSTANADFSFHPLPSLRLLVKVPPDEQPRPPRGSGPELLAFPSGAPRRDVAAALLIAGTDIETLDAHPLDQMPGYYEVTGVSPGEVRFYTGSRKEGEFTSNSTTAQISGETQIDLTPSASLVSVSGTVDSNVAPVGASGDDVALRAVFVKFSLPDGRSSFSSRIGPKDQFALSVPAGSYRVDFEPPGLNYVGSMGASGAGVSGRTVTFTSGAPAKMTIHAARPNCTVTGTALKNGKPAAGVMILLVPEDPSQNATLFHRDQSDSDGTFTLGSVLPGRYTLLAIENGWDLEWSSLSVLFPYLPSGIPITLKPAASVSANPKVQ